MEHNLILNQKFNSLINNNFLCFNEVVQKKNIMGVYIAYSEKKEILYIGSTNKFNIRFGTDLKHETTHTLMNKLLKSNTFTERKLAKDYLIDVCKFKIEICQDKREAEALEHFAIWALNPFYNK